MSGGGWCRDAGMVLAHHYPKDPSGNWNACVCGHVVPLGASYTEHQADMLAPLVDEALADMTTQRNDALAHWRAVVRERNDLRARVAAGEDDA